jgi:hypothetical protein
MKSLPIVGDLRLEADRPVCAVISGGLSVEQVQVADEMRRVKQEVRGLSRRLEDSHGEKRAELEARMESLRQRWCDLVDWREEARRRKMVALGHGV